MPARYIRKQTLANCERYITEELNELENKILGAEEKIVVLEYDLFIDIRNKIAKNIRKITSCSKYYCYFRCTYIICSCSRRFKLLQTNSR